MTDDKKNLGHLIAVDMPNGYTYIGREEFSSNSVVLKEVLLIKTANLVSPDRYELSLVNEVYKKIPKENLEKTIKIGTPGPIHYLEQ